MAQPAPIQLDLSTLRSNGNGQGATGPSNHTQIQPHDARYRSYLKASTTAFNKNPHLVQTYGPHEFVGTLPHGFTLWAHPTSGQQREIVQLAGNPRGGIYRSAADFSNHIGELLRDNNARDAVVHARIPARHEAAARSAVAFHNDALAQYAKRTGNMVTLLNPNNMDDARAIGFVSPDAAADVLADRGNHAGLGHVTCNCRLH